MEHPKIKGYTTFVGNEGAESQYVFVKNEPSFMPLPIADRLGPALRRARELSQAREKDTLLQGQGVVSPLYQINL